MGRRKSEIQKDFVSPYRIIHFDSPEFVRKKHLKKDTHTKEWTLSENIIDILTFHT